MRILVLILCLSILTACTSSQQIITKVEYLCPTVPDVPDRPELYEAKFNCMDLETLDLCNAKTKAFIYTIDVENSKNLLRNNIIWKSREQVLLEIINKMKRSEQDCNSLKNKQK